MPAKKGLHVHNSWEALSYFWDGAPVDPKTAASATVRWPDGHHEDVKLKYVQGVGSYSDHGHEYTVPQDLLTFSVERHGYKFALDLRDVEKMVVDLVHGGSDMTPSLTLVETVTQEMNGDRATHTSPCSSFEIQVRRGAKVAKAGSWPGYDGFNSSIADRWHLFKEASATAKTLASTLGLTSYEHVVLEDGARTKKVVKL